MIRHIVIAGLRNMAGNKLISAIAILGLAAGIATALLMALVVQNQMSFDHFLPGHERTYRFFWVLDGTTPGQCADGIVCGPPQETAEQLQRYPAIETTARLQLATQAKAQNGAVMGWEQFAAADPNFFDLIKLPLAHGDLAGALAQPGGVVVTSGIARKYFGRDDAVGRQLTLKGFPLEVRAVIEDLPPNATTLSTQIFVPWSDLPRLDPAAARRRASQLYVRLKPGATFTDAQATEAMRRTAILQGIKQAGQTPTYETPAQLMPLGRLNLWEFFNRGSTLRLTVAGAAGVLVLLIAAINFVNLMVARAARREKEVGVRKASGSGRGALMLQFMGEAVMTVAIAAAIGVALAEWLLPALNAFLDTNAVLAWNDPLLLAALSGGTVLLALAVGLWPAIVLSGFRPAFVLRGASGGSHTGLIRGALVTLQFSILITLAIAGAVMWLQRDFAERAKLRTDIDQMLLVRMGPVFATTQIQASLKERTELRSTPMPQRTRYCPPGFIDEVRKLPGVQGAVCTDDQIIGARARNIAWQPTLETLDFMMGYPVDPRLFALYGIRPLAGSLPQAEDGDETVRQTGSVINLTAMRKLGFASPQAALGKDWLAAIKDMDAPTRQFYADEYGAHAVITAVVPDFSFGTARGEIPPTVYSPWADAFGRMVHIKLRGENIPETLTAIDRLYARSGIDAPLDRVFVNEHMRALYRDVTRDASFFAGTAGIAILLACMGLVGIAVATAERRTKEIGVRKVMGATTARIVGLLLWGFSLPVLLANVVAWPVAWWLMRRWLAGFAYRIELEWWIFAAAGGTALVLALLTVTGQAIQTARRKPVLALRYE